jgi:hypothetical protein
MRAPFTVTIGMCPHQRRRGNPVMIASVRNAASILARALYVTSCAFSSEFVSLAAFDV